MVEANIKIVEELKEFLRIINTDSDLRKLFTNNATDFTRSDITIDL